MNQSTIVPLLSLTFGVFAAPSTRAEQPAGAKQPNVIILLTDDQGFGDLSAHGNPVIKTPNMDRLHESSVRLNNFHVDPTCAPTRGALMTGKYSHHVRVWHTIAGGNNLRETEMTMADAFKSSGYKTALFGKWHLGANYPYRPMDRGFDEWLGSGAGGPGTTDDYFTNDRVNDHYWRNGRREYIAGYNPSVFYDTAVEYVKKNARGSQPFFLYVPTYAPHGPHSIPDPTRADKYADAGLKKGTAYHYAMIDYIDEGIGRLLDALDETGIANDTIVIFMTDNGATAGRAVFNAGMKAGKGSEYDGGHRVPFFIRWPNGRLAHGQDVADLNAHIDVLPTLIDLCGLTPPKKPDFDGRSFKAQLYAPDKRLPTRVVCVERQRTLEPEKWVRATAMQGPWRLVNDQELYKIDVDPGQKKNLIAQHPEVAGQLRKGFEAYWKLVSPNDREYAYTVIGAPQDPETLLTADDWRKAVWNHGMVAQGKKSTGAWHLTTQQAGTYQFEVRRWPREAHAPMAGVATLNKQEDAWVASGPVKGLLYNGPFKALLVAAVRLSIDGQEIDTKNVAENDEHVTFNIPMEKGKSTMEAVLVDQAGKVICGAYYVYVQRKNCPK